MPLNFSISRLLFRVTMLSVFGAAIHICIILIMPYVSQGDAWQRLQDTSKLNELVVLPDAHSNKRPIAFMAPDVHYAICRYDLTNGPLELRSPLLNDLWSIALYSRYGENYFLISGRDVQSRAVKLLVVVDKTLNNEKQGKRNVTGTGNDILREITVSAPSTTGVILIRAPIPNPAFTKEISDLLDKAFCHPVDFAQQANRAR